MRRPFDPPPRDTRVNDQLGEIPDELFDDLLYLCCELVDRYSLDHAYDLALALGVERALAGGASADAVAQRLGTAPGFRSALGWLLDRLATDGALEIEPGPPPRYRLARGLATGEVAELRTIGLALDPEIHRTLDLLDAAAAAWPAVASGRSTGEQELFAMGHIGLWIAYFHNANASYGISNRIAAIAAVNRLRPGGGLRLLEVGAGAGSAAEALLEELERRGRLADLERYDVTEPSPFFRRRAERELKARFRGAPLRFAAADVDLPLETQGLEGPYDLVLGVNVLHVARDLGAALRRIRAALAPDGWLVAGECLRLFPGQAVPAELVFQLFKSFIEVETDPELRPDNGFLEPRHWRLALGRAGFVDVGVVPDLERIRLVYPRFFSGAMVGRAGGPTDAPSGGNP
jgi:SAM-dependent methyltransferase